MLGTGISLIGLYSAIDRRDTVFLDSSMGGDLGRRSVIGLLPYEIIESDGVPEDSLDRIGDREFIGFISYDASLDSRHPDLGISDSILVDFDILVTEEDGVVTVDCKGRIRPEGEELALVLDAIASAAAPEAPPGRGYRIVEDTSRDDFTIAVLEAQELMRDGEFYIVNIARMMAVRSDTDPFDAFLRLRELSPSPFGAYLDINGIQVISSSMELLLDIDGNEATTRPIKGTCPHTGDPLIDRQSLDELLSSGKEFSELLMVTDMERNDMNRFCVPGSVKVRGFRVPEEHPTVYHTVSDIAGTVRDDVPLGTIVSCMFPGGSVTGAPKEACIRHIDRLERSRRGLYTGSIGFFSHERTVMSIAIRTMVHKDGLYRIGVGGGITVESDPGSEYEETVLKGRAMLRALGREEGVFETMLVREGTCILLEEHLARLAHGLEVLGICNPVDTEYIHCITSDGHLDGRALRVEVTASDVSVSDREVAYTDSDRERGFRLRIHTRRRPGSFRTGIKSNRREELDTALREARADGYDEVLILNTDGEVCEGSVSNIFLTDGSRVVTPRASCGLLPGTVRDYVIRTFGASEEVVRPEDLGGFTGCFLTNSLYGVMPVRSIGDIVFPDRIVSESVLRRYLSDSGLNRSVSGNHSWMIHPMYYMLDV